MQTTDDKKYKWPKRGEKGRYCRFCGRKEGLVRAYGIQMCRQCFRERASDIGFKKYG